jgi:hypothetical protein
MSGPITTAATQDAGIFAAPAPPPSPPVAAPVASVAAPPAPTSWAQMRAQHRNARQSVRIPMRADLVDEMTVLEEQMRREDERDTWENRTPVAPQLARQIQELEAQVRDSEVLFVFEALGRGPLAELNIAHPATAEIKKKLENDDLPWHPETFPPALMAACCVEPAELRGNVAAFEEIHRDWASGQVMAIWGACMSANGITAGVDSPKSLRASEILRRIDSESNSTTASP